jgi:uncharacterized membrane protein YfcA
MFQAVVAAAAALAAAIAAVSGFGIGSLLTPLFASEYGIKTAVAAVAIPHAFATFLRFWRLRRNVDFRALRGFGILNAAGSLVGALLQGVLNSSVLIIVLGVLLVFAGIAGLTGYSDRMRFSPRAAWIAGAVSGLFGGLVGNQGGIRAAAMFGLGVEGAAFVATATAIGLAVDSARLPVYLYRSAGEMLKVWPAIGMAMLGVLIGTLLGERLLRRIPQMLYRKVVAALLTALGIFLLVTTQ